MRRHGLQVHRGVGVAGDDDDARLEAVAREDDVEIVKGR